MDLQIRKRLAAALKAKRISMKQASLTAGLGETYVRDVIRRDQGKFELLENLCKANGISWHWVKTGEDPFSITGPNAFTSNYVGRLEPDYVLKGADDIIINRAKLVRAMAHAFQLLGASEAKATMLAELVLEKLD